MRLYSVRGAITVPDDSPEAIQAAVAEMVSEAIKQNNIPISDIAAAFFTMTPDLTSFNPALAVRRAFPEWNQVPMLCSQEALVQNMMPRCIRLMIQWMSSTKHSVQHIYLQEAAKLRPDLALET